jgi:hypothetical protein
MTIPQTTLRAAPLFLLLFLFHNDAKAFVIDSKTRTPALRLPLLRATPTTTNDDETNTSTSRERTKNQLLSLVTSTPSNAPTSKHTTDDILAVVRELEAQCPTPEADVVPMLGGNWELLWTAQDQSSDEWGLGPLRRWIK